MDINSDAFNVHLRVVSLTPARQLLRGAVALAEAVNSQLPALVRPRPEPPPGPASAMPSGATTSLPPCATYTPARRTACARRSLSSLGTTSALSMNRIRPPAHCGSGESHPSVQ
jgi:hypothetical protein